MYTDKLFLAISILLLALTITTLNVEAQLPGNFSIWVQNTTATSGFASLEHDAFNKSSSMTPVAMDIVLKAKFHPESVGVCTGDKQPYVENVQLPRSNIQGDNTTTGAGAGAGTGTTTAGSPPKKNGTSSIEKNVLLSIVCGLIIMIFGFVGTVYV
ncbi:hypothetical protein C1645_803876 [Glomus cerebriforme]|uniref:Uncharacterized protein n=1 Tax=Glomus cerebriforme TaxID=658196 RepID=A0A397TFX4_9GLOM|nr:hypothetical protein C1645_803876 [Glomus cerebriforme]